MVRTTPHEQRTALTSPTGFLVRSQRGNQLLEEKAGGFQRVVCLRARVWRMEHRLRRFQHPLRWWQARLPFLTRHRLRLHRF